MTAQAVAFGAGVSYPHLPSQLKDVLWLTKAIRTLHRNEGRPCLEQCAGRTDMERCAPSLDTSGPNPGWGFRSEGGHRRSPTGGSDRGSEVLGKVLRPRVRGAATPGCTRNGLHRRCPAATEVPRPIPVLEDRTLATGPVWGKDRYEALRSPPRIPIPRPTG